MTKIDDEMVSWGDLLGRKPWKSTMRSSLLDRRAFKLVASICVRIILGCLSKYTTVVLMLLGNCPVAGRLESYKAYLVSNWMCQPCRLIAVGSASNETVNKRKLSRMKANQEFVPSYTRCL